MKSQDEEYEQNVWEIYRKEWETASPEKKAKLNKWMRRWQELMENGMSAIQAYIQMMEENPDETPIYMAIEEGSDYRVREEPSGKRPAIASGPRMGKVPLVFLSLALVAAIVYGFVITEDRNTLNTEKATLVSEKANLEENVANLNITIEEVKSDLDSANNNITSLEGSLDRVISDYDALSNEFTELKTFYYDIFKGEPPPYRHLQKELMNIVENTSAKDPTWQQLVDFLNTDQTDSRKYVLKEYVCTGFTEDLHNNAEAFGIRSSLVFVRFEDSEIGHSLNAFNTVDRGLVFIDNTGVSGFTNRSWDRVAYLRIGELYGAITIDAALESFEYEYYELKYEQLQVNIDRYEASVEKYYNELADYNSDVQRYNVEVGQLDSAIQAYNANPTDYGYSVLSTWQNTLNADFYSLKRWSAQLDSMVSALDQELAALGIQQDQYGGVLGIVKEVKMYW